MERGIATASFQPPNFKNKEVLGRCCENADEIVEVMQPDDKTHFRVCSSYVLSSVTKHLETEVSRLRKLRQQEKLLEMVERSYVRWCVEVGVPEDLVRKNAASGTAGMGLLKCLT